MTRGDVPSSLHNIPSMPLLSVCIASLVPYYAYYYYFRIISNRVAYDSSYMMYKHILPELIKCRAKRSLAKGSKVLSTTR